MGIMNTRYRRTHRFYLSALAFSVAFLGILFFPNGLNAQSSDNDAQLITAGDGTLSASRFLTDYTNTWAMVRQDPDGKETPIATWHDQVEIIEQDGKQLLKRTQYVEFEPDINRPNTTHLDLVDARTLLPVQTVVKNTQTDSIRYSIQWSVEYDKYKIRGQRPFAVEGTGSPKSLSADFSFTLDEPIYDWHLWGLLVAGLPLEDNKRYRFLAFLSEPGATGSPFISIRTELIGSESIRSEQWGKVDCRIVDVDAGQPWRLWISKSDTVAPIQQIRITRPDGGYTWWRPVK